MTLIFFLTVVMTMRKYGFCVFSVFNQYEFWMLFCLFIREVMNSPLKEVWAVSIFSLFANNFAINIIAQKFLEVERSDFNRRTFVFFIISLLPHCLPVYSCCTCRSSSFHSELSPPALLLGTLSPTSTVLAQAHESWMHSYFLLQSEITSR